MKKRIGGGLLGLMLAAAPAAAQTNVKIGVLGDSSGPYADFSGQGSIEAVRMAVEDFDAAKHKMNVEVIAADPQNKPDIAVSLVRRWFDTDGVDMIVDMPTSGVALALVGLVKEKNKAMLASTSGSSELTGKSCSPNHVHWTWDTWSNSHGTAEAVVKSGGKSWFFLTADYTFGTTMEREA